MAAEVQAQRGCGPDGAVERLAVFGRVRVEHHQRVGAAAGDQPVLDQLAAAGDAAPVDPRCRRADPVGAQPVDLEVHRLGVKPDVVAVALPLAALLREGPPRSETSTGSVRGSTRTS